MAKDIRFTSQNSGTAMAVKGGPTLNITSHVRALMMDTKPCCSNEPLCEGSRLKTAARGCGLVHVFVSPLPYQQVIPDVLDGNVVSIQKRQKTLRSQEVVIGG